MKNMIQKFVYCFLPIALVYVVFSLAKFVLGKKSAMDSMEKICRQAEAKIRKLSSKPWVLSEENLEKLIQKSKKYETDFMLYAPVKRKFNFNFFNGQKPKNEVDFYFSLMSYVQFLGEQAQKFAVNIPKEFSFGFEPYVKKDLIPDPEHIQELYGQSKIMAQLLMLLYESNDHGLDLENVMRERVDLPHSGKDSKKKAADTMGTIDGSRLLFLRRRGLKSYLFTFDFTTYSSVLRRFINKLQEYNLPVLIRSLEIKTPGPVTEENTIMSAEKSKIVLGLEWLFIEGEKKSLEAESVAKK
ncbi:MAG: Amuc_1100 family pilus-like protein [Puniceicoccales bacterium]|jgi:hypothetical protein|nr:Amuc_1100 family pilus-like protein [Puniceicoccales bacterium]